MIINDKALAKLMNHAKKNGGYRVAMTKGEPAWIYITYRNWYVGAQWDKLSAKIKGILAEHLGQYIQPGEAWHILKKSFQEEFYENVIEHIFELNTAVKTAGTKLSYPMVKPTPIMWRDTLVYRKTDGELLLMDPALMDMAAQLTWYPIQVNDWLFWDAGTEQLYIEPEEPHAGDVEFIKKIAALDWAPKEE